MMDAQSPDVSAEKNTPTEDQGFRFIKKPLFRRKGRSVDFDVTAPPKKPEPVRRPAKVAQMLALAHHLDAVVEGGEVATRTARREAK